MSLLKYSDVLERWIRSIFPAPRTSLKWRATARRVAADRGLFGRDLAVAALPDHAVRATVGVRC